MRNIRIIDIALKNEITKKRHELWREIDQLYEIENGKRNLKGAMRLNYEINVLKKAVKDIRQ